MREIFPVKLNNASD